jgi:Transposase domain (DUF772)
VAVLLYSYALGERSSRRIERRCIEDVTTRVICANQTPDHTTVARFRQRHERALAELFGEVLALCAEAGLVAVGVVAIDGTKVHANASERATRVTNRSRGRSSPRRTRSMPRRMSASARPAAMNCPRSSPPAPGARRSWLTPSGGSSSAAPWRRGRFRPRGPGG